MQQGLDGRKAKEAPRPMRRGLHGSQSGEGPTAHAVEAFVVPKRRRPPCPCGRGLGGPKARGGPLANAAAAS